MKCQSKAELAGSPRNVFRCSDYVMEYRGKALFRCGLVTRYQIEANSEYYIYNKLISKTTRDKLHSQEGNSPDHQLRPQNNG